MKDERRHVLYIRIPTSFGFREADRPRISAVSARRKDPDRVGWLTPPTPGDRIEKRRYLAPAGSSSPVHRVAGRLTGSPTARAVDGSNPRRSTHATPSDRSCTRP